LPFENIFSRQNEDVFRWSGELVILLALFFLIPYLKKVRQKKLYSSLFCFFFLIIFYYHIYLEFSLKLYGDVPHFLNDITLIRQVLPIFLGGRGLDNPVYIIGAIIGFIGLSWLFIFLLSQMIRRWKAAKLDRILLSTITVLSLISLLVFSSKSSSTTVQWTTPKMAQSADNEGIDKYNIIEEEKEYQTYLNYDLTTKPNIYLIVVEAYGSMIHLAKATKENFGKVISNIDEVLTKKDWFSTSNYSISPIQGGRSWLAFSSLMTGLNIENQLHYNDLLYNNAEFPHLIRYLNGQDYRTYRLTTLSATEDAKKQIPQAAMNELWDYTRWFQFDDIPYRGYAYNKFGGIPDQYAMGYFNQAVTQKEIGPEFLFFITMTSHAPWYEPPAILEDWTAFDTMSQPSYLKTQQGVSESNNISQKFEKTLEYEMEFLSKFITETADSNSVFILVGDHQPAGLMYQIPTDINPYTCPIHIISKDEKFIKGFESYGFNLGMNPIYQADSLVHHAGMYSLLMREMIRNYGTDKKTLPPYFPKGIE